MTANQQYLQSVLEHYHDSAEIVNAILKRSKVINFKKGEILIKQGHSSHRLGIIAKGLARWYEEVPGETENILLFFGEEDFITAPFSFFNGEKAHGTIQAIEDTEIHYITRQDFDELGKLYPEFKATCFKILSDIMMQFWSEKNRMLRLTATERYLYFQERYASIAHRISLGNVSAYLGMRQSSLSRVRREITEKGW